MFICITGVKRLWRDDPITKAQKEYIHILSSYPDTKDEDKKDIENFLKRVGKNSIDELTKGEAHDLINILLKRLVKYKASMWRRGLSSQTRPQQVLLFWVFEGCLHECPRRIYIGNCSYWMEEVEKVKKNEKIKKPT